jgi:hypothetical protein
MRGADRRTTSDRPGPGGYLTEDSGPSKSRSKRFGEPRLPPSRPEPSAHADHPTGFMIADAVRYMSVHSWKQPDSHGHRGIPPGLKQQPATRETPGHGLFRRWWQVLGSNQRRLSRRFYREPIVAPVRGPDLLILRSSPRQMGIPSAPRPCIPSRPDQRAEGVRNPSSGVPMCPIPPSYLHRSPGAVRPPQSCLAPGPLARGCGRLYMGSLNAACLRLSRREEA